MMSASSVHVSEFAEPSPAAPEAILVRGDSWSWAFWFAAAVMVVLLFSLVAKQHMGSDDAMSLAKVRQTIGNVDDPFSGLVKVAKK